MKDSLSNGGTWESVEKKVREFCKGGIVPRIELGTYVNQKPNVVEGPSRLVRIAVL